MEIIEPITQVKIYHDPDDNKFLGCTRDSHALYIVSGDKDLLVINEYEKIKIVTAKDFSSNICPPDYIDWLYIKQNIKFCRSL